MKGAALARVALASTLLLCSALSAQTQTLRLSFAGQQEVDQLVLDITPVLVTHGRPGPAGFVICAFDNPDSQSRKVWLRIEGWNERVGVRDTLVLEPKQRLTRHYAVQNYGQASIVKVEGEGGVMTQSTHLGGGASASFAVLLITERSEAVGQLQSPLSGMVTGPGPSSGRARRAYSSLSPTGASPTGASAVGISEVRPAVLPQAWQCLAAFDLLVLDGRGALEPSREQAIVDAMMAGSSVLVLWGESLGDGPLRRAFVAHPQGRAAFGRFLLCNGPPRADELQAWITGESDQIVASELKQRQASGPAADALHDMIAIPGLGRVPVGAFFVLLTLFVIVAGPLNLFLCRRAKKPMLVAFTLPLLGFGFAGAILLWGVLSEGLGVRGSVRSITWLDQRQHVAVSHAGATMFAGLTPSFLTPGAGTLVSSLAVNDDWGNDTSHRYVIDHSVGGRLNGGLLPARTQTCIVSVAHSRVRERLRFRRLADGSLEVLFGPGLVPTAPGLAVRDYKGHCYVGAPGGDRMLLQPVDEPTLRTFLRDRRDEVLNMPTGRRDDTPRHVVVAPEGDNDGGKQAVLTYRLLEHFADLQPGSYAGFLRDNVAVDTLGLDVAWEVRVHLVLGLLAEEDFLDQ